MMWKTFGGRCIHQGSNNIQVRQNIGYRWLTFGSNAIQTLINRRHPERCGLQYIETLILAAAAIPGPSCLLGLGGAGVAHALASHCDDFSLDAVESNLDVIGVSSNYFMTGQIKNLNIIHQDAYLHVQQTDARYQHLLIDLFNAYSFPAHCNNTEFFGHCRRILFSKGMLAVNLANVHEQWPVFLHIRANFPQCVVSIPVKGTPNVVVLAYKGDSVKPMLHMLENHPNVMQLTWDSTWGYVARINTV